MLKPPVSISMAFVRGMLQGPLQRGESTERLLEAAGIDPVLLNEASARVTGDQYIALFRAINERLGDDGLGFFSRRLKIGSLALIVRSSLGAPNLEVAMRRMARTFGLLQDDVEPTLVRDGQLAGWEFSFSQTQPNFMHELMLRIFWRVLAWLHGGRLHVERFDLAFPSPPYVDSYQNVFPGELRFDQVRTALWFDGRELECFVRRDEAALRAFFADAQLNFILPRWRDDDATTRVRSFLQSAIPEWPDSARVAEALAMSTSTLQRNLALEGTSFQSVKDELRRDLAVSRLVATQAPLAVIAEELGFSDSAAFQRAFKAWTGSPAGAYRRR